jgi:succinate dehydrogenase / fumarate reductase, membrane anchor subunit
MRNQGIQSGGAIHWLMQRVTGIVLVLLLALHTIIAHYTVPQGGLTFQWVAGRMADPLWKLFYLFFLILCIYHGLNGIWMILQDYVHRDGLRISLFGALVMLALLMLSLGTLTILPFTGRM